MKSINNYINEHMDQLGHELKKGDFIQFKTRAVKPQLYGQIQDITDGDKPKYKVRVLGWYGDESLKSEIKKDFYEIDVNSKHIFQLNWKSNMEDQLRKDGIII